LFVSLQFDGKLGDVPFETIPTGLGAINKVPVGGWFQIVLFCFFLEQLAPQLPDKVPGQVQVRNGRTNNRAVTPVDLGCRGSGR
jgi:hypothetical protein